MIAYDQTHHDVDPSIDELLSALSNSHQRCVIYCLLDADDGHVTFDHLVEYLTTYGPDAPDRERVEIHLHHTVLPRLTAAGLVEFDRRSETVRLHRDGLREELIACLRAHEA